MPLERSKEPEVTEVERGPLVFVCAVVVNLKNENMSLLQTDIQTVHYLLMRRFFISKCGENEVSRMQENITT
jgi:hypothetical protein